MAFRNTTCEKTLASNADYQQRGGLALADAFAIHHAIHSTASSVRLVTMGVTLPISVSANGCRRVDVIMDADRPLGRCKFLAQNMEKESAAAKRARAGAKITHCLPLDGEGKHTAPSNSGDWGMFEDERLARDCAAVLNRADVAYYRAAPAAQHRQQPPMPPPQQCIPSSAQPQHVLPGASAPSPSPHVRGQSAKQVQRKMAKGLIPLSDKRGRVYLDVPFHEKDEAKRRGALFDWDAPDAHKLSWKMWYVPPTKPMAPFQRWLPAMGSYAAALHAVANSGNYEHPLMLQQRGPPGPPGPAAPIAASPAASTAADGGLAFDAPVASVPLADPGGHMERKRPMQVGQDAEGIEGSAKVAKAEAQAQPEVGEPASTSPKGAEAVPVAALSAKERADALRDALGLTPMESMPTVAKLAAAELGVKTEGLSLVEQLAQCHALMFA